MTTAVKASLRSIGTCGELSPLLPCPLSPLSFLAFWGFPEWKTQGHPFPSLVCPWTVLRSWEHLPFPFLSSPFLSLSLSFFLFSLSTFLPPWVSLDAFVIAGNPSPLFFRCVLGRSRRSWEHLPSFSFLFLVYPRPSLLSGPWLGLLLGAPGLPSRSLLDATRGSWPCYYFESCLPSGRRVCVTLGVIGMLLHSFVLSRGLLRAMNTLEGIAQRRPFHRVVIFLRDASGTYLQQF